MIVVRLNTRVCLLLELDGTNIVAFGAIARRTVIVGGSLVVSGGYRNNILSCLRPPRSVFVSTLEIKKWL